MLAVGRLYCPAAALTEILEVGSRIRVSISQMDDSGKVVTVADSDVRVIG
jgi:hypothetical protein